MKSEVIFNEIIEYTKSIDEKDYMWFIGCVRKEIVITDETKSKPGFCSWPLPEEIDSYDFFEDLVKTRLFHIGMSGSASVHSNYFYVYRVPFESTAYYISYAI